MARKMKANRRKRREIQATDAEWEVINSAAGKVGVSTSEFVRRCAFHLDLSDGSTRKEDAAVHVLSSFDLIEKSLRMMAMEVAWQGKVSPSHLRMIATVEAKLDRMHGALFGEGEK